MSPLQTSRGRILHSAYHEKEMVPSYQSVVSRVLMERSPGFEKSLRTYPSPPVFVSRVGNSIKIKKVHINEESFEAKCLSPIALETLQEYQKHKTEMKILNLESEIEKLRLEVSRLNARNSFLQRRVEALIDVIKSG
jgi:hypothetical protein